LEDPSHSYDQIGQGMIEMTLPNDLLPIICLTQNGFPLLHYPIIFDFTGKSTDVKLPVITCSIRRMAACWTSRMLTFSALRSSAIQGMHGS
jgi:hypothetical protein